MAQFARPSSDITTNTWATPPLWSNLSEVVADDTTTQIFEIDSLGGDSFEVKLSTVLDPLQDTGHILRIRTKYSIAISGQFAVFLKQGASTIAFTSADDGTTGYNTTTYTLTTSEAAAISDYSNLSVLVSFGGSLSGGTNFVTWIELQVPNILTPPFYDIFLWMRPDE